MHPCLYIHDIVELIARFAEDGAGPGASPALALLQTCRAFYEAASNIRWGRLKSFQPLLNLFFLKERVSSEMSSVENMFGKDLQSWALFRNHSRRVRTILTKWTSDDIGYLQMLYRCRPDQGEPLLPGLQDLTLLMVDPTVDIATLLEALVSPSVHTLRIVYLRESFTSPSFDILRLKAPRLQKLQVKLAKLGGSSAGTAANQSLLSLIPDFSLLTTLLYIDTILPTTVLVHLGTLPHLTVLNAALGSGSTSTLAEQRTFFPKLRRLWLAAMDGADVAELLEAISSNSLESLYIVVKVQPKSTLLGRCLDLAARHPQLSQLNIHYSREVRVRMNTTLEYIVDNAALQPLLKLPHLTNIGLRDTPLQLSDDFLHRLATSCSQLRELVLGTSVRQRTSGLTMEGLKPLALNCPKLYLLAVTFATPPARESTLKSKLNWVFDRHQQNAVTDDGEGRNMSLRFLDIGSSRIQDPEAVAAFVTRYFPNVQEVSDLWDLFLSHKNIGKLNKLIRKWGQRGVGEYVKYHSRPLAEVLFSETAPLMN